MSFVSARNQENISEAQEKTSIFNYKLGSNFGENLHLIYLYFLVLKYFYQVINTASSAAAQIPPCRRLLALDHLIYFYIDSICAEVVES
jgi:hypothetical protein